MAFLDRSPLADPPVASTGRAMQLFAAVLLVTLMAALALRAMLPLDALAPAVATLLFAIAATTAGITMLCRRDVRPLWYDVAGVLTFVGVAITLLIEPEQIVRLVCFSEQPD
ncbi:MAG: hypothetical protein H7316_17365 [Tardiphaga sp.]|uniref:hypothetical protein n=1 Tax=Tardiphaga sp. TaxID=1926292 RepID=UPI0019A5B3C2|nr:hypothetical protein [Tardiphaga sp.]MBC7585517.1 hypothetical protein [Tardiphaga sp.]